MADETKLYKFLVDNLDEVKLSKSELPKPDATLEQEVADIFVQARKHRNRLIIFYVWYTIIFTVFVFVLIACQAHYRIVWHDSNFEIIPQWALNLLVTGMFAQFVGLLTIVTQRVWDFKPFFAYHNQVKGLHGADPIPEEVKAKVS
ncbi:MAG TPA: hypothetical protein VLE99_00175 [Candidatus Saccharimonadales bacterium]|nr:hypothetical protein [Candidatus Saccharimonadales bacterium]